MRIQDLHKTQTSISKKKTSKKVYIKNI